MRFHVVVSTFHSTMAGCSISIAGVWQGCKWLSFISSIRQLVYTTCLICGRPETVPEEVVLSFLLCGDRRRLQAQPMTLGHAFSKPRGIYPTFNVNITVKITYAD